MNIYVVVENQFPDTQIIAIMACKDSDQAKTAYERMWNDAGGEPVETQVSGVIEIATCNLEAPAVLWKNFLTPKERQDGTKAYSTEDDSEESSEGIGQEEAGTEYEHIEDTK